MYRVPSQQRRNISKIKEERYCCLFLGLQAINEQENTGAIVCVWHWKGPVRQRYVRRDACGNVGMMSLSHTQTRQTSGLFHPSSWLTYLLPPLFLATVIQQQRRKSIVAALLFGTKEDKNPRPNRSNVFPPGLGGESIRFKSYSAYCNRLTAMTTDRCFLNHLYDFLTMARNKTHTDIGNKVV